MANYLTESDVQDYGPDLVNFAQRAAAHALSPQLENLERANDVLRQRLAVEARARMDTAVEKAVPNFREIDADPRWHNWLLNTDILSGRQRQQLLDEAIRSSAVNRVIGFFRQFENQAASQASYYGTSSSGPGASFPSGRIYSRGEISKIYEQHRRGAYAGRESEWARQEAEIIAAGREGRIRGGVDIAGK